jgi:CBS domain containing-hemolysin-like protein
MAETLGRVPIPGAQAIIGGLELTAESMSGRRNRIDTVLVRRVADSGEEVTDEERGAEKAVDLNDTLTRPL